MAARVVRGLLDSKKPPGVRELAMRAGVDPGYVSRVLALLDREALIKRRGRGRVVKVDWVRLLRRWANDAPLASRGTQALYLEPRGLTALESKLAKLETDYAITGTLAAMRVAPLAPPRLATVYVEDMRGFVQELDLRPAETAGNVLLIEPNDPQVAVAPIEERGLRYVAVSQAAAELVTGPGRGPEAAEELIAWMAENEEAWRR
jgi:hypothetical protein